MIGRFFALIGRGIRSLFTLKGLLTVSLLAILVAGMVFALPKRVREPKYVAPIETTETASLEPSATPRIAIVFVGLGGPGRGLETLIARLLALNTPLTYAVAPSTSNSKRHAQLVGSPPGEVDLALPVAFSKGKSDPAPGQVSSKMRRREIGRQVVRDIYTIGRVSGIVAPGGYATNKTDAGMMRIVMAMAKRRNLYFLDTESNGAAKRLAGELEVEYLQPDVTLDKVATADGVKKQMSVAINKAVAMKGNVIVLAHLLPVTVNTMQELVDKAKAANIEFTTVSQLNAEADIPQPSLAPTSTGEGTMTVPSTTTIMPSGTAPGVPELRF
ncbi:MAG: divergent polysaccharide deacetylase family protein [Actinobacteria bacterium]|nr:MAG: divergent polysaccharide deacetylase family protein [Actinomycetota bacterium]